MKAKVNIIIYSMYGHIFKLAEHVKIGLEKNANVQVKILQVPETLSSEILGKMHAPPKPDIPVATLADMEEADGLLFGVPTRYGQAPAQMKAFWDATGQLWVRGGLRGKLAGLFVSTASQHGGQEMTAATFLPHFVHHGMTFVPIGYAAPELTDNSEIVGGSAWGAGTIAGGDGSRQPSAKELSIAEHQGKYFGEVVEQFVRGRTA